MRASSGAATPQHVVAEGAPLQLRLDARAAVTTPRPLAVVAARNSLAGQSMPAAAVVVDADLGPGGGEVVEDLGVDVGEGLGAPLLGQVVDGGGGGVAGVVPALERGEQDAARRAGRAGPTSAGGGGSRPRGPASAPGYRRAARPVRRIAGHAAVGPGGRRAYAGRHVERRGRRGHRGHRRAGGGLRAGSSRSCRRRTRRPPRTSWPPSSTSPASILLLAVDRDDDGTILGSLTLVVVPHPDRRPGLDRGRRRRRRRPGAGGWGRPSTSHALERARMLGAKTVDLTSRPSREAANRLYQRIGFVPRETNVYRFDLG